MAFPKRKTPRLERYDYNQNGVYFVTFCTRNRVQLLSSIVGRDDLGTPSLVLTHIGVIVEKYINSVCIYYPDTRIDKYVIMPNHVHLLINIDSSVGGVPGSSRPTQKIPRIIAAIKRFTNSDTSIKLWQDGFYDHIIRDEKDYLKRWQYIDDNPSKWAEDDYYVENN